MPKIWSTALMLSGGLAFALAGAACNTSIGTRTAENTSSTAQPGTSAERQPAVTLTGCLEKGSGHNDFILSPANTGTRGPVGTSGSSAASRGDVVGQEQLAAAEKSYRLNGDDDQLNGMVGKQVRVMGHMVEPSDLKASSENSATRDEKRTSGVANRDRQDIDASDLAKVDVQSIDKVADECGSSAAKSRSAAPQQRPTRTKK